MPRGTPRRVTVEFDRRGELVRVSVLLERGALEDLQALLSARHGQQSRSQAIREAVRLLLAREALQVLRGRAINRRRAQRAAVDARAAAQSREHRDQEDVQRLIEAALRVAADHDTTGDDGWLS
jgi:metal-responsive CopG/Arc/MetJ family transcriptional regulator